MLNDILEKRYSVRHYSNKRVSDELINEILKAGKLAPTAANKQPQKIYVLNSETAMDKARTVTRMMYSANQALLVCYDNRLSWKGDKFDDPAYDGGEVDAAIITTTMMYKATELGVGTLWVRGFSANKCSEVFELDEHIHPVCFLLLGYPSEKSKPIASHYSRNELDSFVEMI